MNKKLILNHINWLIIILLINHNGNDDNENNINDYINGEFKDVTKLYGELEN